nr:uncharacterized protein LOC129059674 [Pongo abelii]
MVTLDPETSQDFSCLPFALSSAYPTGQDSPPFFPGRKGSVVDRTKVSSRFPLHVLPGLGVSGAQADPRPNSRRVEPAGAWKSARTGVEVGRRGREPQSNPLLPGALRTCPRGCQRKWPIKLLCNRKRPEAPGGPRGASLSEPSLCLAGPGQQARKRPIWRIERKKTPKGFESHDVEMLKASNPKVRLCGGARGSEAGSTPEPSSGESSAQAQSTTRRISGYQEGATSPLHASPIPAGTLGHD